MNKVCKKHGLNHFIVDRYGKSRCGKCSSNRVTVHRQVRKKKLIELLGGKCVICGYNNYAGALDFHHVNPKEKRFGLSSSGSCRSWREASEEAKKCILVCKNHHAEIEAGIIDISSIVQR